MFDKHNLSVESEFIQPFLESLEFRFYFIMSEYNKLARASLLSDIAHVVVLSYVLLFEQSLITFVPSMLCRSGHEWYGKPIMSQNALMNFIIIPIFSLIHKSIKKDRCRIEYRPRLDFGYLPVDDIRRFLCFNILFSRSYSTILQLRMSYQILMCATELSHRSTSSLLSGFSFSCRVVYNWLPRV